MNIKEFCAGRSNEELRELQTSMEEANKILIANYVSPDNICTMVQAIEEDNVLGLGKDIIELSISYMCNQFNYEIIEKELFRREMEDNIDINEYSLFVISSDNYVIPVVTYDYNIIRLYLQKNPHHISNVKPYTKSTNLYMSLYEGGEIIQVDSVDDLPKTLYHEYPIWILHEEHKDVNTHSFGQCLEIISMSNNGILNIKETNNV